jgi:hypothetical protein
MSSSVGFGIGIDHNPSRQGHGRTTSAESKRGFSPTGNPLYELGIEACYMALHPKSKIVALRALLAVTWGEERRLLTIINSDETPADEMSMALNELHKLRSQIVLKLADIEDATVPSASGHLPEQIATPPIDHRGGNPRDDEHGSCMPWECPPNSA